MAHEALIRFVCEILQNARKRKTYRQDPQGTATTSGLTADEQGVLATGSLVKILRFLDAGDRPPPDREPLDLDDDSEGDPEVELIAPPPDRKSVGIGDGL